MTTENLSSERGGSRGVAFWLAVALQLAVAVFPYSASGLVAPLPGLIVLALIWIGLFVFLWRWRPRNQWLYLLVPVAAVALWFAVLTIGERVFGWTA